MRVVLKLIIGINVSRELKTLLITLAASAENSIRALQSVNSLSLRIYIFILIALKIYCLIFVMKRKNELEKNCEGDARTL